MFDETFGTDEMPWVPPGATKWDRSVMQVNTPVEQIYENIRTNIKRPLPQFVGHGETRQHVGIVGGGWSLADTQGELEELYHGGLKLCALNGAGNWLMERNLRPSMQIMLDAKDDDGNRAFVEKPIPGCRYFIASQCHPSIFDICEGRDVTIFHALTDKSETEKAILQEHYLGRYNEVPSSGTVGVVAIMLLRLLGFRYQHLFGLDSCYRGSEHHAYPQAMNDGEGAATFWVAGREFRCSAWQAAQAGTFWDLVKAHGDKITLSVHGDGVLAHMLKTGAGLCSTQ